MSWLLTAATLTSMLLVASAQAQSPQWIGTAAVPPVGQEITFSGTLDLPKTPKVALARVAAYDRYRLAVNGKPVGLGDTPWDADTHDLSKLLTAGPNRIEVTATAEVTSTANCWLWLRRKLPTPGSFNRLTFRTQKATGNEWLYLEVVDDKGRASGFYCLERQHPDLALGTSGKLAEHTIDLLTDPRLAHGPQAGSQAECDFSHLVSIAIRVDQKDIYKCPNGQVELSEIKLSGDTTVDLTDPKAWRLEAERGEWRRSALETTADGALRLRYDFSPAPDPKIAVDVQAWDENGQIGRLVSGPRWKAVNTPVQVTGSPASSFAWTRLELRGPGDKVSSATRPGVRVDFGGLDRCTVGEMPRGKVLVWALEAMPGAQVQVRAENWSGKEVLRTVLPVTWDKTEGQASFEVPALPRGLYRFTATLVGEPEVERHTALAVLEPGQTRVSSIYDTLTPVAKGAPWHGVDTGWNGTPAMMLGLRDQGVNLIVIHLGPSQLDNGEYDELLAFCRATGIHFQINNEHSNWVSEAPDPTGRNRFDAPGGCHRWDLEAKALDAAAATGVFEGVVYDEGEHMQLCRNNYSKLPDPVHRMPYLVETTGMTLPQAYEAFLGAARGVSEYNRAHGARMLVESVFPALWHPLARAGVTLCPKLLKEDINPVVLALSLGAAKQYDAELWYSPDFWFHGWFPGHTVEEYEAALRLAHAAGVDNVYTEGLLGTCRLSGATYQLTEYGLALRSFVRDYLPAHPRNYTYRDYEPEVAIVRFPDSDWGQASCYYWKTLYGAEDLPPTAETGEWMQIFNLLTGGTTDPRAVNTNSAVYPREKWDFTLPCPPVAVFDHLVGEELLRTANTLFLCGITVSDNTLTAVRNRVRQGTICFAPARLCPEEIRKQATTLPAKIQDGTGSWIVVESFTLEGLGAYAKLLPTVGTDMRLRFKGQEVRIGALGTDPVVVPVEKTQGQAKP